MPLKSRNHYPLDKAMMMIINDWIAWDEDTDDYLYMSRGRRMSGRPARFIVARHHTWGHIGFTASSIQEALDKAIARFEKGDLERAIAKDEQWKRDAAPSGDAP